MRMSKQMMLVYSLFENDDGLAFKTDDDCVEYKDRDEEEEGPPPSSSSSSANNPHPSQSSGNTVKAVYLEPQ